MGTTLLDCGQAERDALARLATPSRNRYYYGKLLDAYHLELEQRYGNNKRWLLNRLTLGAGVLCGLDVVADANGGRVRVRPGVAVDGVGREIVVPADSLPVDPRQPTDDCGRPDGEPVRGPATVTLYLCYHECEAEPAPVLVSECGPERTCENGLVRERYRLRVARGVADPPGSLPPEFCARIFSQQPNDVSRRALLCTLLAGACDPPDEACVALAVVRIDDNGRVAAVDRCARRRTIYSNAVLLDLILCLADRVDQCCGQITVRSIFPVSGDDQAGTAGQPLELPLVVRVVDGGNPVPNEPVTFAVVAPGGAVGTAPATLADSVVIDTGPAGVATLPVWRLGPNPGVQRVTASIATGTPASVTFRARAERAEVDLPVVRAIWPPNGVEVSPQANDPVVRQWADSLRQQPRVEVTFNHEMDPARLGQPDRWLRAFVARSQGPNEILVRRVVLAHAGRAQSPILGAAGFTELFVFRGLELGELRDTRWLVLMRADGDAIVDTATPAQSLDAEFEGTRLTAAREDEIWELQGPRTFPQDVWDGLAASGATLPQSGDGAEGGRFASWFATVGLG